MGKRNRGVETIDLVAVDLDAETRATEARGAEADRKANAAERRAPTTEASSGSERLVGTIGDDLLVGLAGDDVLRGGRGFDTLQGGDGADRLLGGLGIDTASYADAASAVTVDLGLTGRQDTGAGRDALESIENLTGSRFADTLRGDAAANRLRGGLGSDTLTGGAGGDVFAFKAVADSRLARADRILDFSSGEDRMDLSAIDANARLDGDQAFVFIGESAFTGFAGQLRAFVQDGDTVVQADVNGDEKVDLQIILAGAGAAEAADFGDETVSLPGGGVGLLHGDHSAMVKDDRERFEPFAREMDWQTLLENDFVL